MTVKNTGDLLSSINGDLADNNAGLISAEDVRHNMADTVESINLIVSRAGGDRENLKQELDKIYNYAITNKNVGLEKKNFNYFHVPMDNLCGFHSIELYFNLKSVAIFSLKFLI